MIQQCQKCKAPLAGKKCDYCGFNNKKSKKDSPSATITQPLEMDESLEVDETASSTAEEIEPIETAVESELVVNGETMQRKEEDEEDIEEFEDEQLEFLEYQLDEITPAKQTDEAEDIDSDPEEQIVAHFEEEITEVDDGEQLETTTLLPELDSNDAYLRSKTKKKLLAILSWGIMAVFLFIFLASQFNQSEPDELRYICTFETSPTGVEMVVIIESRGLAITKWIEEFTFPRQLYVDQHWGSDWDIIDDDIRSWYESSENITYMEGTYWELVFVDDEFVVNRFVYHYEIMSREDLDSLWDPNFSGVNHYSAIRVLTEDGGICMPE